MSGRKKTAGLPRPAKQKTPPAPVVIDLDALLSIGDERVVVDPEENDNASFMAEIIDPL
jgi:hypothetical protein